MRKIYFLALVLSFCNGLMAQSVQTPAAFLGYALGEEFTYHHEMVNYFEHVAANSPKVVITPYGKTYERRPLMLAFVSSEENIKNLEQIRQNNLIMAGLAPGEIVGKPVTIVWLSYNIHGNEAVSMEAAMQVLHTLATGQEGSDQWLQETLVVLDPCENPDGRDRYANWYNQAKSRFLDVDPLSWEHNEPWPGGRFNHYIFDLNRDWAWQTQLESQHRSKIYKDWMPHVHVDLHEMGVNSPYFFGPSAKPFHEDITPWQREFHELSGRNHAKYFDANAWLYFTKEVFDLFYPSYGDTWPTYNGAIGFTYEQGGSGRAGLGVTTQTGDTLTLKARIAHHYAASMSTIEVSYLQREKMLDEFRKFFATKPASTYKSFVIKAENNPNSVKAMLQFLDNQAIRYGYANTAGRTRPISGFSYQQNANASFSLAAEDIVINLDQPKSRFVKILFEPKSKLEDSITYDLTAWAVPYIYGLEAYAVGENLPLADKAVSFPAANNSSPADRVYAFLAGWNDLKDVQFLAALARHKIKVRYATEPFNTQGKRFAAGTLIVARADNAGMGDAFEATVLKIANEMDYPLTPSGTGLMESGRDFGSGSVRFIGLPRVATFNGDGVFPTAFGELWHFFEQQLEYPITVINTSDAGNADLSDFDVIVLPSGRYNQGNLEAKLMDFVRGGGKLIAMEYAIELLANNEKTALGQAVAKQNTDDKKKEAEDEKLAKYGDRVRNAISDGVEGSIYRVTLDETHPLAFGLGTTFHTMKRNSTVYPYLDNGWNVGTIRGNAHVSGFVGSKLKEKLKDSMVVGLEPFGRGQIIYFADSPIFRGFWHSGKLMLGNAIFFSGR